MQRARNPEMRPVLFTAHHVSVISVSLNLPHAAIQGLSESGSFLHSVLLNPESQFDFDKCTEGFPRVLCFVSENLPRFRFDRPCFNVFLDDSYPASTYSANYGVLPLEEVQDEAVCATIGNSRWLDGYCDRHDTAVLVSVNRMLLEGGVEGHSECRAAALRRFKKKKKKKAIKGASDG